MEFKLGDKVIHDNMKQWKNPPEYGIVINTENEYRDVKVSWYSSNGVFICDKEHYVGWLSPYVEGTNSEAVFNIGDMVTHKHFGEWYQPNSEGSYVKVEYGVVDRTIDDKYRSVSWYSEKDDFLVSTNVCKTSLETYDKPVVKKSMTKETNVVLTDGGPSSYYDFPDSWNTLNDFIEYKSEKQWGKHSFHLGNIVKAVTRWGDKGGTTLEYDAKKIIYSGCRVLMSIVGKDKLRVYLQSLLDDTQFK